MAGASKPEKRMHEKNEQKCKLVLVQHIVDNHIKYVKDKRTAKEIFDVFRAVFRFYLNVRALPISCSYKKKLISVEIHEK
jgi:hypothetical protein